MNNDYLPGIYQQFLDRFPDVADAQGALARTIRERSPFIAALVWIEEVAEGA